MQKITDSDLTLPSVANWMAGAGSPHDLVLTIIFHPDTQRIGQRATLPGQRSGQSWVLGRFGPVFFTPDGEEKQALDDGHISRAALSFCTVNEGVCVARPAQSSRCRLGGTELREQVLLKWRQLDEGVPLLLGHTVVLMLRRVPRAVETVQFDAGGDMVGGGAGMTALRRQLAQIADSETDVLLRGETGTGKELVANALHGASRRAAGPLITINMAAIPADLAAGALFGSARGAYTGADRARPGYFAQAQGGTLFLDEIGDTPQAIQPLLLRALQEREIQCVGGAIERVDVRVIAATDMRLEEDTCNFKAALRHRLAASEIEVPPLRHRCEDIGELFRHCLQRSARELGRELPLPDHSPSELSSAAWAELFHALLLYRWPGNIRELGNLARQLVLAGDVLPRIPPAIRNAGIDSSGGKAPSAEGSPGPGTVDHTAAIGRPATCEMASVDAEQFERVLRENDYAVARTARQLGVSRQAVYRRIDESPNCRLASELRQPELASTLDEVAGDSVAAARRLRVSLAGLRSRLRNTELSWY